MATERTHGSTGAGDRGAQPPPVAAHLTIALASAGILLYEIALTRLLSVVLWYHFAFLAISLAMLGLGAPGVWMALRPPGPRVLWRLLIGAAITMPLAVVVIVKGLARITSVSRAFGLELSLDPANLKILLIAVCLLVPLVQAGGAVCLLLITARGRRIGSMYGADLLGATAGACLIVPLLRVVPTPHLLGMIGLLPLAGATLVAPRGRRRVSVAVGAGLVALLVWGTPFELHHSKTYAETAYERLYETWTPTARLTVFSGIIYQRDHAAAFGWGLGSKTERPRVEQYWVDQDGSAGTPITRLEGDPGQLEHLDDDVTSVGYQLARPGSVCIIGAGGGRDILTALRAGATHVDAVELHPELIDIVSDVFGQFSGDPYHLPGVQAHAAEGRSFLTRTAERYDLIQISLIDSWAATTAGAYALSENYLYTTEAVELYWDRLSPEGMVSISRWSGGMHQLECARLVALVVGALERLGVPEPRRHIAVIEGGYVATVLVARAPFETEQVASLDAIADRHGFLRRWPAPPVDPGAAPPPPSVVAFLLTQGTERLTGGGLAMEPPTDDRPFFFQNVRAFTAVDPELVGMLSVNDQAARLPRFLIVTMACVTASVFFTPFVLARRRGRVPRFGRAPHFGRGSAYFLAIGVGFMLVEIPLLQKAVLFLGHPSYATTVVLSALLLGSGLGALAAGRLEVASVLRWRFVLPAVAGLVNLGAPWLFEATLGSGLASRVLVGVALVMPLGVVMGFAFPAGMIRFGEASRAWFWAMNGTASVLATVSSVALAAYVGLSGVIWIGVGCYLVACVVVPPAARDRQEIEAAG